MFELTLVAFFVFVFQNCASAHVSKADTEIISREMSQGKTERCMELEQNKPDFFPTFYRIVLRLKRKVSRN